MASKRIDELDARVVADTDLLPVTPSGGPSGRATVAAIVAEGLSQPNSASAGAGASITIKAADGVTSGAGGSITITPGAQATTGGDGKLIVKTSAGATALTLDPYVAGGGIQFTSAGLLRFSSAMLIGPSSNIQFQDSQGAVFNRISYGGYGILDLNNGTYPGQISCINTTYALSSSINNLILTSGTFIRLNCTSASDITGIGPSGNPTTQATISPHSHRDGRIMRLVNVGTATVRLMHNDTGSAAANRMYHHNGTNVSLTVNEWADLVYDSTDNGSGAAGWRVVSYA